MNKRLIYGRLDITVLDVCFVYKCTLQ